MKNIFLLIIYIISINYSYSSKEAKNFLIEFLKATKNEKIIKKISNQCLGNLFDYNVLLIKNSFKENNIENLIKSTENLFFDIIINCPTYEFISIIKESQYGIISSLGYKYKSKIYSKLLTLGTILYLKYNNNTFTGASLGKTFGKIHNLFKFEYSELYELVSEIDDNDIDSFVDILNNQINELFRGIFIGMKEKDDGKDSKCYNDIINGKKKIMSFLEKGVKKIEDGESVGEVLKNIGFNLVTIEGVTVNCNLLSIGSSILSKATSIKEMTKLVYKIMQAKKYIIYIKQFYQKFKDKNMKDAGKYIGKIVSSLFDFNIK